MGKVKIVSIAKEPISPRQDIAAKLLGCSRLTVRHADGQLDVWTRDFAGEWGTPAIGDARYTEITMIDVLAAAIGNLAVVTFVDTPVAPRYVASRYSFRRPGSWAVWDRETGGWAESPVFREEADARIEAHRMNSSSPA